MRFILAFFLSFSVSLLGAQLNDSQIYVDVKTNILEEIYIKSLFVPKIQIHDYSQTDSIGFDPIEVSPQLYKLNYQSINGLIGDFKTIIEYTEPSTIPGIPQQNYLTLNTRVKSSKIVAKNDFALSNYGTVILDPLSNDSSTEGLLTLAKLGYVSGGNATITSDNKIQYELTEESGSILYFIEDSFGNVSSAYQKITLEQNDLSLSTNLFAAKNKSLEIVLPSTDYSLKTSPSDGTITNSTDNPNLWIYDSTIGYTGGDTFSFESSTGAILEYNVSVLNSSNDNTCVNDDHFFVTTEGTITFNVLENDFRSDAPIIYSSPDLTEVSNGVYSYSAPAGFIGDKTFEYKVFTGLQVFTGIITLHISNFAPIEAEEYAFTIIQDKALRLTHNTPISDYYFESVSGLSNGSVEIFDEFDNQLVGCDSVSGANTIIYTPNSGYTGLEEFDIRYCTTTGFCEVVKVDISVVSSSYSDCVCLEDCVFEGDHNDDGRVDFLDILDLGLNIGEGGSLRTNSFEETWTGQYSSDWGHTQIGSETDLKCGDSDGDGYIDYNDLASIDEHYGKLNKFQTTLSTATTEVPVYFIPQQTEVDSGELLILDIAIGDPSYPAIDMNGLAFSFNIAADLIDSSSVNFYLYDNNWLAYNNPVTDYSKVPADGRVDIAVTRLGSQAANGHGIIGALEFIVEDEINGFKRARNNAEEFIIELNNIISVNGQGVYVSHPNYSQKVRVNSKDDNTINKETLAESIFIYPNPTSGLITISSSGPHIDKIAITDVVGRTLDFSTVTNSKGQFIDLSSFENGLYFISVHSGEEVTTKKVHKVNL